MNNIVTAIVSGQEKISQVNTSATGNASPGGFSVLTSSVDQDGIESFQHALQRFRDGFTHKEVKDDTDLSGNNMPLSALISELPARNDHALPSEKVNPDDALSLKTNTETGNTSALQAQAAKSHAVNMPVLRSQIEKTELVIAPLESEGTEHQTLPLENNTNIKRMPGLNQLPTTPVAESGFIKNAEAKSAIIQTRPLAKAALVSTPLKNAGVEHQTSALENNADIKRMSGLNQLPTTTPAAESGFIKNGDAKSAINQTRPLAKAELVNTPLQNAGVEHQTSALDNNTDIKRMPGLNQLPTTPAAESGFIKNGEAKSAIVQTKPLAKEDLNTDKSSHDIPLSILEDGNTKLSAGMVDIDQASRQIKVPGQGITIAPETSPLASNIGMKNSEKLNHQLASLPIGAEVDITIDSDSELSMLPSQMHAMLKMGANSAGKIVHAGNHRQITANIKPVTSALEPALVQSIETMSPKIEPLDVMSQILTNTTNQQQVQPNIQASLIAQIASVQSSTGEADTSINGLPLVTTTASNTLSIAIPQAVISEAFGRPEWSQGMGKQILWMVNQNIGSAEIRLNPAHLGPIEILIDMSEDQVNVSLSSRHAVVREAMEQALPKLREMLDDNGFNLADTDISKHSFAEQREQESSGSDINMSGEGSDEIVASEVSETVMRNVSLGAGMIDYYI